MTPPNPHREPVHPPGAPGTAPTWCSSAKEMVGCALGPSRLWYTVGGGIVNEVYYPRADIPQIRDLGFIVADDRGFWVEVKRLDRHDLKPAAPGIPALTVIHRHERFTLKLRITPDPARDVLLIDLQLEGDPQLRPYALCAPHLGGTGCGNFAECSEHRGRTVLWAEQGPFGLALAAADTRQRDAWARTSAGYVGISDGWHDFHHNGAMRWQYPAAGPGDVALMGELPRQALLALGFASSKESAATLACSALLQPFDNVWRQQVDDWEAWHEACAARCRLPDGLPEALHHEFRISAMVLRCHQDKIYPGAMVASLSVPWGNHRDERGGYHLVWPRDLVECAGALLALGAHSDAQNILRYLIATQHADGHWYQNQWLGGKPFWKGIQLDQAAFPVLLACTLAEQDALDGIEVADMVRRALRFIVTVGPASDQDRWEEDAGVNTFTLAVCIAALVAGARYLAPADRTLALTVADYWNSRIEDWTFVRGTALARKLGVSGYYVRVAPAIADEQAMQQTLPIKNRTQDPALPAEEQVGVDFLQLVRFGLRRPDDPAIVDTLTVTDALLKVDTPVGPCWHRYNGDGYGEHRDGSAFNGTGRGRAWPLLTGERGHYELAAGRSAVPLLQAMAAMSDSGGMLPEQVWDGTPMPERALFPGRPTGSAMPLAWAHAEFIKLMVSIEQQALFDRPETVWQRYHGTPPHQPPVIWATHAPVDQVPHGARLLICLHAPGTVHWGIDGWQQIQDTPTEASGLGLHVAELDIRSLQTGQCIDLTFRDKASGCWAGRDDHIAVIEDPARAQRPTAAGVARAMPAQ